ncbi:MAG: arabinan endo-1,5-alpha-L-arabinosidase [Prevotella sp.]|nr:arabinan endo-1,5-alpha-L-arabinosidase [Prevotella sp.]MCH3970171.1 arabinan endo-1,5-alpha-L-arabinosidase [Prevotella sp.]
MNFLPLFFSALFAVGCSTSNEDDSSNTVLSVPTVSEITSSTAQVTAAVTGSDDSGRGFCYADSANPTINSLLAEVKNNWTITLTGLHPHTMYYVRAFVETDNGPLYSDQVSFQTTTESLAEELAKYVCPSYQDDYTSIASWDDRASWNLANVHDPTVMRASDGYYYMYQTDASYGNVHEGHGHFFCRRSKNLVDWEFMGATMSEAPAWVKDSLNSIRSREGLSPVDHPSYGFWAPCVRKINDHLYRMYYAIAVNNYIKSGEPVTSPFDGSWTEHSFIGMMETNDPSSNQWQDKGFVICSSSDRGKDWYRASENDWDAYFKFNAIDPSLMVTPEGQHWLIYGSWHSGIAAVQLDPESGKTMEKLPESFGSEQSIAPYGKLIFTRTKGSRWQGAEAPEVIYHDGYYYLFLAYDALDVPYNTRVLRSKCITGPYMTYNGAVTDASQGAGDNPVVLTHPYKFSEGYGWVGISHCAVFDDSQGNWFYASQQRFPEDVGGNPYSNAIMMGGIRSIKWTSSGWPVVMPERYGDVPQAPIADTELVGNWEHIDLGYSYGHQKQSSIMTFGADHTIISGAWKGAKWNFDPSTNTLNVNGIELEVQREVDWEADPRRATIVYAGLDGSKSYWGKKVE